MRELLVVLAAACAATGCSRQLAAARLSRLEPPAPEEIEARDAIEHRSCTPNLVFLFPGAGQLCLGQTERGAVMGSVAAAEIGAAVAGAVETRDADHPAVALPVAAVSDLWVYGVFDMVLTRQRASAELYVPRDTPTDLVAAPFNLQVMKRPGVWIGLGLALATGIGVSLATADDEDFDPDHAGDDPDLFGKHVKAPVGYPLGFAAGAGLFGQVALAEESVFRGYLQSALSRAWGENTGWVAASLIFGAAHIANVLDADEDDRNQYLLTAIPVITATGFAMGWLYRDSGYSLAPSVAMHFWYDLLLSSTFFVLDPENSLFSARVAVPF